MAALTAGIAAILPWAGPQIRKEICDEYRLIGIAAFAYPVALLDFIRRIPV